MKVVRLQPLLVLLVMLGALIPLPAADAADPLPDLGPDRETTRAHLLGLFGLPPIEPIPAAGYCKPGGGCFPLYVDETGDIMTGMLQMRADIAMEDGALRMVPPATDPPYPESHLAYDDVRLHMPVDLMNRLTLLDDMLVNGSVRVTGQGNTFEVTDGATFVFDNISVDEIIANTPDQITFRVNNTTVFRLVPTAETPNIIGGFGGNNITHPDGGLVGSFIGGGGNGTAPNLVRANYSILGGGLGNTVGGATTPAASFAGVFGGHNNTATHSYAVVGGGRNNAARHTGSTVAGGHTNTASGAWSFVGSGWLNQATDNSAVVTGGQKNVAEDWLSGVLSGSENTATGWRAVVLGGYQNTASANASTVLNGYYNEANGLFSVAAGRQAKADHDGATVLADSFAADFASTAADQFNVRARGGLRFVSDVDAAGAAESEWRMDPRNNFVGGHAVNHVDTLCGCVNTHGAVIAGGGALGDENIATGPMAVIGGGMGNEAGGTSKSFATIGGGLRNRATEFYTTVGGGEANLASGSRATVTGGWTNTASGSFAVAGGRLNVASAYASTVAGGNDNDAVDDYAVVAGGSSNQAGDGVGTALDAAYATVGGGLGNTASAIRSSVGGGEGNTASADSATVSGGYTNTASGGRATVSGGIQNTANNREATVAGGSENTASGDRATVAGGRLNTAAGDYSLAAGRQGKANHDGAFVWSDSSAFDFASTAADEFSARATGGVRFVSAIDGSGGPTAGVTLAPGAGSWSSLSDRNMKQDVVPIDPEAVLDALLAMPLYEWSYIAQGPDVRHMGPMAQDFGAAFGLGADDTRISTVDADGVALAAIQGLHQEIAERDQRIDELEARLAALEAMLMDHGERP